MIDRSAVITGTGTIFKPAWPILYVTLFVAIVSDSFAQRVSSLSESELEAAETRVTLEKLLLENQRLNEQLALSEATANRMTESIVVATTESEIFRRQAGEMRLRVEALGFDAAGNETSKMEQRLLSAVNELRVAEQSRAKTAEVLQGLAQAVSGYVKSAASSDAESRVSLEVQMRRVGEVLSPTDKLVTKISQAGADFSEGLVISTKDELNLVVASVGATHGVKVGMPFQVFRGERTVGTVRVIDVRAKIAGAVVQNLDSENDKIHVGDRLKVSVLQ